MKGKILFLVIIQFFYLKAQQIILPVNDNFELKVKVKVSIHPSDSSKFIYEYSIKNMPTSGQPVKYFKISNERELPWPPIVDTVFPPINWRCIPNKPSWQAEWKPDIYPILHPGDSLSGFIFHDRKLPDIGYWYSEGMDTIVFPTVIEGDVEELEDSIQKIYYNKTPFGPGKYGYTVVSGPLPPGEWNFDSTMYFVSDSGFYHLIDKTNKCFEQNWLKERAKNHLISMYERGLRHYQNNRVEQARKVLSQIIDYLERERGNLVFDEAFYVLYYRTKFVSEHLLEQYRNK